jgi:general secretion pathway protein K
MRNTRGDRGSATILMMLISAVIITVGLGFNWLVREHLHASEGLKNKAEAILKARSAYDTIVYLILNGRFSRKEIIIVGGTDITELKTLPLNNQIIPLSEDLQVRIQDSNGMLSLVALNRDALERLVKKEGGLVNASDPVSCLLDWIDPDDFTGVNGAEAFYYIGQGLPYVPRNYALQYKEEVGFVKGIGPELYGKIQHCLTMLPSTGFNPNTASDQVLMAYLNINEASLTTLKEFMVPQTITADTELFGLTGRRIVSDDGVYYVPSTFMDITVNAGRPKMMYTIKAGLNLSQTVNSPYDVLYWIEE